MSATGDQVLRRVAAALTQVINPATGEDVISSGRVRELQVAEDGLVRFRFTLKPEDPGSLVREARAAAEAVEGVAKVKIDVGLPAAGGKAPVAGHGAGHGGKSPLRPGSVPAPTPDPNLLPGVKHVIAVSSGKGGVGKSTVATNLAAALVLEGKTVGLLDADVYGPNIPLMFGERRRPQVTGEKGAEMIEPLDAHGVRLMSLGFLLDDAQPAIMRGPLISGIMKQFLEQVQWGPLDYLIVDMPPGTGDAQLSLVQTVTLDGALMVTTPQDVSISDVARGIKMFERVNARVIGIVENMSGYICPCCDHRVDLFGSGGAQRLSELTALPLLAQIPLEVAVREGGDAGVPIVVAAPESASAQALREVARQVMAAVEVAGF